jgi:major membrane immunogen (membrane-anchored lipoprotein)
MLKHYHIIVSVKFITYILRRVTMKKFKLLALVMVLVLSISVLAACGSKTEPVTTPEPTPAPTEQPAPTPTPEPATDALKDGVYKAAQDNFDERGWKGTVEVEVKDAKIANVKFDYVNKDGALKSQDAAYKAAMEPVTKTYPEKAFGELQVALVEKQDVAAVTAVAGATTSSNDFIALVKIALEQAK